MKRVSKLIPVILIALALGFSACQKDSSSTPGSSTLGIKIQALNKSFALPVNSAGTKSTSIDATSIVWDSARMTVSRVKYEAEVKSMVSHRDSIKISYEWRGPQEINLFDTNIALGNFTLQPGNYDEIEIQVDGFKKDAGDKPVFYLHGNYSKTDGTVIPIKVTVNENITFKTEKDSVGVALADNPVFTSVIQLYLDKLMSDMQITALDNATLTDGIIVISADSNTNLYRLFVRNLLRNHHSKQWHGHWQDNGHNNNHNYGH